MGGKKKTKNNRGNSSPNSVLSASMSSQMQSSYSQQSAPNMHGLQTNPNIGTADMIGQSREVLYGHQNMQNVSNIQPPYVPTQIVNNQTPSQSTLSTNTHVTYPYSQPLTGQSITGQYNVNAVDPNNGMNNGMHITFLRGLQICVDS